MLKTCFKCGDKKSIELFYKHRQMVDGRLGKCISCTKKDTKATKEKNPEYYRELSRVGNMLPHRVEQRKQYLKTTRGKEAKKRSILNYQIKHPLKKPATQKVNNALRSGALIRGACFVCGNKKTQGHHEDYTKPLEVVWLCVFHHRERHKQIKKESA